jgi:hypothetical protein
MPLDVLVAQNLHRAPGACHSDFRRSLGSDLLPTKRNTITLDQKDHIVVRPDLSPIDFIFHLHCLLADTMTTLSIHPARRAACSAAVGYFLCHQIVLTCA